MAVVRRARVSQCCAALLVLLIVLPFTPPFSTCGLSDLLGEATADHGPVSDCKSVRDAAPALAIARTLMPPITGVDAATPLVEDVLRRSETRSTILRL